MNKPEKLISPTSIIGSTVEQLMIGRRTIHLSASANLNCKTACDVTPDPCSFTIVDVPQGVVSIEPHLHFIHCIYFPMHPAKMFEPLNQLRSVA